MTPIPKILVPLSLCVVLAACSGSRQVEPITAEPIYNKFGAVTECVGADGRIYPARPERPDPCEPIDCPDPVQIPGTARIECPPPDDCPDGFYSSTGEWICPAPDINRGSGTSGSGRDPGGRDPNGSTATPGARG